MFLDLGFCLYKDIKMMKTKLGESKEKELTAIMFDKYNDKSSWFEIRITLFSLRERSHWKGKERKRHIDIKEIFL